MGCLKLIYYQPEPQLKVVIGKTEPQQKLVQSWLSVDPMADDFPGWTPYHYCHNNPVNLNDPFGLDTVPSNMSDEQWHNFDANNDVAQLPGVNVSPKNEHGVNMFTVDKNDETFTFSKHGNPLYAKDNTIENYVYYTQHPETFTFDNGDPIPFNSIFKSDSDVHSNLGEDILLEIFDAFAKGNASSNDVINELKNNRRSKYANRFPSNNSEFKATKKQQTMKKLYGIEKNLSPYRRSPEFYIWEKTANDPSIIW